MNDVQGSGVRPVLGRAYGASTFEEEKRRIIETAKAHSYRLDLMAILPTASVEVLNDLEVASACIGVPGTLLLQFFSESIRDNDCLVMEAVLVDAAAFRHASDRLRGNKDIALKAVQADGLMLERSSLELRADKEVVLAACVCDPRALWFASPELRQNKEFVLVILKEQWASLEFASIGLRADKEVVLAAVRTGGQALEYASRDLQADRDVVLAAKELEFASINLRADKEVVLAAVKKYGGSLLYACDELKADREVVFEAITKDPSTLAWASQELRCDKDFLAKAARCCSDEEDVEQIYEEADPDLHEDLPWEKFDAARNSALAIPGETAPVLSANFLRREAGINVVEFSLPSGLSVTCNVSPSDLGEEDRTLEDLAEHILVALRAKTEDTEDGFFITFDRGDGDFSLLTAWDCEMPLAEFLSELAGGTAEAA